MEEELGNYQECHSRAKGLSLTVEVFTEAGTLQVYQMLTYEVGSGKLGAEVSFWFLLWQLLNPWVSCRIYWRQGGHPRRCLPRGLCNRALGCGA